MYLLVMVLDNAEHLSEILDAWQRAGVPGITILESTGVNRVLQRTHADPAFAGFGQIFGGGRVGHNTIFSIIDDLVLAETAVAETEKLIGSMNQPHTGVIFAVPVAKTWGAEKNQS